MLDLAHMKMDDPRPAKGGWAPGGYTCKCRVCGCTFSGEKRAYQCADCAHGWKRTTVVNLRYESADVYCGKGSPLGNQFMSSHANRQTAIERYEHWFLDNVRLHPEFRAYVLSLAGKRLGCHCKPKPCHVDVIAAWIDAHRPDGDRSDDLLLRFGSKDHCHCLGCLPPLSQRAKEKAPKSSPYDLLSHGGLAALARGTWPQSQYRTRPDRR